MHACAHKGETMAKETIILAVLYGQPGATLKTFNHERFYAEVVKALQELFWADLIDQVIIGSVSNPESMIAESFEEVWGENENVFHDYPHRHTPTTKAVLMLSGRARALSEMKSVHTDPFYGGFVGHFDLQLACPDEAVHRLAQHALQSMSGNCRVVSIPFGTLIPSPSEFKTILSEMTEACRLYSVPSLHSHAA